MYFIETIKQFTIFKIQFFEQLWGYYYKTCYRFSYIVGKRPSKKELMDFFCLFCTLTSERLSTSLLLKVILVHILYHIYVDACEQFEE